MKRLLGCAFVLALFTTAGFAADEKIDVKKLLGKWQNSEKDIIEFKDDGKLSVTGGAPLTGTWKLDGNKLTLTINAGENMIKDVATITKLTDDELAVEDEKKQKKQTLKRVK